MLVLLSGVSGAGKNKIKKELLKRMENIETLPSFTDRLPREGEKEGEIYHFVTRQIFEEKIKNDEFYEYNMHHDHYYGTSKKLLNEKMNNGKIIVKDIEVNGTENLVKILKNDIKVVTIFLRVPKEELRKRLLERTENPNMDEIELRLSRFDYEESKMNMYDYVIKNNDLEKTLAIVMTIINKENELENVEF